MIQYHSNCGNTHTFDGQALVYPAPLDGEFTKTDSTLMQEAWLTWPTACRRAMKVAKSEQLAVGDIVCLKVAESPNVHPQWLIFAFTRHTYKDTDWLSSLTPIIRSIRSALETFQWKSIIWPNLVCEDCKATPENIENWRKVRTTLSQFFHKARTRVIAYGPHKIITAPKAYAKTS
jgi:hypothetical protein